MLVKRCTATDPTTKACTKTETVTGTQVLAAATRSLLSPDFRQDERPQEPPRRCHGPSE